MTSCLRIKLTLYQVSTTFLTASVVYYTKNSTGQIFQKAPCPIRFTSITERDSWVFFYKV